MLFFFNIPEFEGIEFWGQIEPGHIFLSADIPVGSTDKNKRNFPCHDRQCFRVELLALLKVNHFFRPFDQFGSSLVESGLMRGVGQMKGDGTQGGRASCRERV